MPISSKQSASSTSSLRLRHLGEANITFDKFHIIQALNKAQDEVRRTERKLNPLLADSRYIWLKNPENLTAKQKGLLETLRYENLKTANPGIRRYFTSGLTSGAMEGINSRIQEIKRRARGFRNIDNFISMLYLEAAGLEMELPT